MSPPMMSMTLEPAARRKCHERLTRLIVITDSKSALKVCPAGATTVATLPADVTTSLTATSIEPVLGSVIGTEPPDASTGTASPDCAVKAAVLTAVGVSPTPLADACAIGVSGCSVLSQDEREVPEVLRCTRRPIGRRRRHHR